MTTPKPEGAEPAPETFEERRLRLAREQAAGLLPAPTTAAPPPRHWADRDENDEDAM